MAFPDDPRDISFGFAFGSSAAEDPTEVDFEIVSPGEGEDDPGPVLGPALIHFGRTGNTGATLPTRVRFALRNDDGQFSPHYPTGPRYGTLRRGTPVQVAVDVGSGPEPLATATQPDWTPSSSGPGIDRQVAVNALGVLALLGRDTEPLSALTRVGRQYRDGTGVLRGWWPLEAGDGEVTSTPSGLDGGKAATVFVPEGNLPARAIDAEGLKGSAGALDLSGGAILAGPLSHSPGEWPWRFECAVKVTDQEAAGRITLLAEDGTFYLVLLTTGTDQITVKLSQGTAVDEFTGTAKIADGEWHWVSILLTADVFGLFAATVALHIDNVLVILEQSSVVFSANTAGFALNHIDTASQVFFWRYIGGNPPGSPELAAIAAQAYDGEQAHERIERILTQAGYPYVIVGTESVTMGPQLPAGTMDILRDCEATDEGMLIEARDGRISYLCLSSLENQSDPWVLDYEKIAGVWPDNSDTFLRNIITARSPDGVTATVEAEGDLSPDPETGIGRRPAPVDRNPYNPASTLIHNAGYALARATLERPRCHVGLNLHGEPDLAVGWLDHYIGSRVVVTNLPEQEQQDLGPGDLDVIIVGGEQYLDADVWTVDLWCEPYELFATHVLAEDDPGDDSEAIGWLEYDSCELASGVDTDDTSWSVTCDIEDSSDADDFPRRHYIVGELVTVTASTGGTSPTWTVTRSVNGVVKSHSAGATIELADPLIHTL